MMAAATGISGRAATASAIHHIGVSVASLEAALAFWETFLGVPARWRTTLDRPYLSAIVGIPGVSIKAAFIDLPGGESAMVKDFILERQGGVHRARQPSFPVRLRVQAYRHGFSVDGRNSGVGRGREKVEKQVVTNN